MTRRIAAVGIVCLVLAGGLAAGAGEDDGSLSLEPNAEQTAPEISADFASPQKQLEDCLPLTCRPCPRVYGYAEALFLQRDNASNDQPVIVTLDLDGNIEQTFLATSDLDFDFDPAVRVVAGHRLGQAWAIEGSYLGLFESASFAFTAASAEDIDLTFPRELGYVSNVFSDIGQARLDYWSALHSGELNLVHCRGCCEPCEKGHDGRCGAKAGDCRQSCGTVEWLAGFRYLHLQETFNIYAERQQTTPGPTDTESGNYNVRTHNDLYGAHLGARVRRWGPRLGWEAVGKAGLFGNGVQQEQYVLDWAEGGSFPRRPLTSAASGQVAFVGELNLTGIYRLTDVWSLRAGYNLLWVAGVALAPDQLDFTYLPTSGSDIRSDGTLFLHGVSGGLEARW